MTKYNDLVKRVEVFERLAVYGDRSTFLKSLAQSVDPKVLDIVKQMESLLRAANVTDESVTAPILNATMFKKVDVGAISAACTKAMSQMTSLEHADKIGQLRNLQQQLRIVYKSPEQSETEKAMAGPADITFKDDHITGYPTIDATQQSALGKIVMIEGLAFVDPKKMHDGKLGPETRKALDAFKKWVTAKNPSKTVTDNDALAMAEMMAQNNSRYA